MTKEEIANSLTGNNHIVEVVECVCNQRPVYIVNVYSRGFISRWFGLCKKININKYTYPFYFEKKELIEEFMKYYPELYVTDGTYWDHEDIWCLMLDADFSANSYYMVDSFKKKGYSACKTKDKYHLQDNGIWGGEVCIDGEYHTFDSKCFYFTKMFNLENRAAEIGRYSYYELTPKK